MDQESEDYAGINQRMTGTIANQGAWTAEGAEAVASKARAGRLAQEARDSERNLDLTEQRQPVREIIVTPDGAGTVRRGRQGKVFIDLRPPAPRAAVMPAPATRQTEPRALVLTTAQPPGWTQPEGAGGVPVFVTWGTAGGVIPDPDVFHEPLGYVTSAGNRWVWAKIGLSDTVMLMATSLEFVMATTSNAYSTAAFNADGTPPNFIYVPLGFFNATGAGLGLTVTPYNAGSGSIVVACYISNINTSEGGALSSFNRALAYWRTDNVV